MGEILYVQVCEKCGKLKIMDDFYFRKDTGKHRNICKTCYNEQIQIRLYGIDNNDYENLLNKQNRKCAICGQPVDEYEVRSKLDIDHNHDTGKVRGLLCNKCNLGLGLFNENIGTLLDAVLYLKKNAI